MKPNCKISPKHPIFYRIRERLSRLWGRLFHRLKKAVPYYAQPLPPAQEELLGVDWATQDAMVGTVRSREQFHYNLSHNCYYVPTRFMGSDQPPVVYIALHERDTENIPCIVRIGRVTAVEQVERRIIPVTMRKETDPKEPYCYYTVEEWTDLPHRILIRDTARGRPLFTNKFLLEHCRTSYELFVISSQEDYRLLEGIYTLLSHKGDSFPIYSITENRTLTLHNGMFLLTTHKGEPLGKLPLKAYKNSPRSSFLYLKKLLT